MAKSNTEAEQQEEFAEHSVSGTRPATRDSRRELRSELFLEITFERGGVVAIGYSRNMSLGGLFIETIEPAAFGEKIIVELPLPGLRARVEATVRWTSSDGMGVQLGSMGARETHALMQLLAAR